MAEQHRRGRLHLSVHDAHRHRSGGRCRAHLPSEGVQRGGNRSCIGIHRSDDTTYSGSAGPAGQRRGHGDTGRGGARLGRAGERWRRANHRLRSGILHQRRFVVGHVRRWHEHGNLGVATGSSRRCYPPLPCECSELCRSGYTVNGFQWCRSTTSSDQRRVQWCHHDRVCG